MKRDLPFGADLCELGHRLDGANLVIRPYDGGQRGVGTQRGGELVWVDEAFSVNPHPGHFETLGLQSFRGLPHRRVLDAGDDRVPLVGTGGSRQTEDGQVVGFSPSAGKHYLPWRCPDQGGYRVSRLLQPFTRRASEYVQRRRIAAPAAKVPKHRFQNSRIERCSGGIVQVNRFAHDRT
jgi:hypothetical protein